MHTALCAFHDHAIDGNVATGLDHDAIARLHFTGQDPNFLAIASFSWSVGGPSFDACCLMSLCCFSKPSSFGRALKMVRTDQTAAAALGVNVPAYKLGAMAISASLASLSGSLYAFDNECEDGGTNAAASFCAYGTDCHDCGVR